MSSDLDMELGSIGNGFGFAEGPLWHPKGFLLFSDLIKNEIVKVENGKIETFLVSSGLNGPKSAYHHEQIGSNALAVDKNGDILLCQHGNHGIAKLLANGKLEIIVDSYNGRRLNSPNDMTLAPDGSILFTDPPYGLKGQRLLPHVAQPMAGVYKYLDGRLELLTDDYQFPNGICFSPDYQYVYIGSNHKNEYIKRYEYRSGKLYSGEVFVKENADGLKTDSEGNLYLATMKGIQLVSPTGEKIKLIRTPEMATNLCFQGNEMFITCPHEVYKTTLRR